MVETPYDGGVGHPDSAVLRAKTQPRVIEDNASSARSLPTAGVGDAGHCGTIWALEPGNGLTKTPKINTAG